jgi:uncharacterized surface protein with fasciclin (FAS1) repeats
VGASNAAFIAVPTKDLKTKLTVDGGPILANHKALLQDVVGFKFHLIPTRYDMDTWPTQAEGGSTFATMSAGNSLKWKIDSNSEVGMVTDGVTTDDGVSSQLPANNGVIHKIETVFFPLSCYRTVTSIVTGSSNHTEIVKLLKAADLVTTLTIDTVGIGYTVFAPTNAAFAKIDSATMSCLALPANKAHLVNLLKYHVVNATVVAGNLTDGMQILSLDAAADKYAFSSAGTTLTPLDGTASKITTTDLLATNGVVHVIDTVLIPKGFVAKLIGCPIAVTTAPTSTAISNVTQSSASSSVSSSLDIVALAATVAMTMLF